MAVNGMHLRNCDIIRIKLRYQRKFFIYLKNHIGSLIIMADKESRLIVNKQDGQAEVIQIEFVDRNILEEGCIQQIGDEMAAIIDQSQIPKILISFDHVEH